MICAAPLCVDEPVPLVAGADGVDPVLAGAVVDRLPEAPEGLRDEWRADRAIAGLGLYRDPDP